MIAHRTFESPWPGDFIPVYFPESFLERLISKFGNPGYEVIYPLLQMLSSLKN